MHIGIIEDNPAIADLYEIAFKMRGHTTASYTTGEAFFERSSSSEEGRVLPYDALIIDLGLPGAMSGQDVISRLTQKRTEEPLPFITVVSGAAESTLSFVQTTFPTVTVVQKPVSIVALLRLLEKNAKD